MISRKQYMALTGLDSDTHTALKRRDQDPFPSRERNEYSLFGAFTYLLADEFAQGPDGLGMNRAMATRIVRDAGRLMIEYQDDIEASGAPDAPIESQVYVGRLWRQVTGIEPFCGTAADLADTMVNGHRVIRSALLSASLSYAVLRERCSMNDIELRDLWPAAESVAAFDEPTKALAGLREAVKQTYARRAQRSE